jgi:hypothetical protein
MTPFAAAGFFAGFDEGDPSSYKRSPGDSHYELTVPIQPGAGDSGDDWPAMSASDPAPEEGWSAPSAEPATVEILAPEPAYYRLIESWGRLQFFSAMSFGALSLAGLCALLVLTLSGRPIWDSSISALVVGLLGIIAFIFLSLATTVLSVLVLDLARNIRRLRVLADRNAGIPQE